MLEDAQSPLFGFSFRKVIGAQVRKAMNGDINPFTKQPYSGQYKESLKSRKKLPVYAQIDKFLKLFSENQIMIMMGETGSGMTTQVPHFVVYSDLPHINGKVVACTQSRSSPTISIARRVASEMDLQLGGHVGYSIRFDDQTKPGTTFLQYMTDEVLLREAMHDPLLERYSTIILDEVHERGVASDILIALLKSIAKKRKDLKVIIMSPTRPDAAKFQKYFRRRSGLNAQLFEVPGRTHPVEVFYIKKPVPDYVEAAIHNVIMIHQVEDPGDILLFLSGEQQIEDVCQEIKQKVDDLVYQDPDLVGPVVCIPIYSSLPPEKQQRIFDPSPSPRIKGGPPGRKVVVSSSIPETLKMDGVVYVVDPGFSMQKVYNPRICVESLLVSPISKNSAQQRASCAGRTRPGKCLRLYTEKDFRAVLEERSYPMILASNLDSVVLFLLKIGVKDLVSFDYVDSPAPETLMRALSILHPLGALDDDGNLTPLGGLMAEFPLDHPQLAKTLILSPDFKCSDEILSIVAMLSVGDVWVQLHNQTQEANMARAKFTHPESDHLALLEIYNQYVLNQHDCNWASRNYLSSCALREANNIRAQLRLIMERFDLDIISADQEKMSVNIRQALVCGFYMQAAHKEGIHYCTLEDPQVN